MRFARIVFLTAAAWGFLILVPMYFLYDTIGRQDPPPITHPGFYYGFLGVTLAWQVAFLVISRDPARFRPMIAVAFLEKAAYVAGVVGLLAQQRMKPSEAVSAIPDCLLAVLFAAAYCKTAGSDRAAVAAAPSEETR